MGFWLLVVSCGLWVVGLSVVYCGLWVVDCDCVFWLWVASWMLQLWVRGCRLNADGSG